MDTVRIDESDAIFALATPLARSALAVIRTSGKNVIAKIANIFSRSQELLSARGQSLILGHLIDSSRHIDEVMLSVYRNPRSYTGEDAIEIFCHGSLPVIEDILLTLSRTGLRQAEPGEFTQRAFLNGKLDLTQAEAIHELVESKTQRAKTMALQRLSGSVSRAIDAIKSRVVDLMAAVSVQLDYPDDEIEHIEIDIDEVRSIRAAIDAIAASYSTGRLYQEGLRIALAGKTNAGKSSLFNLFLKEDRAIVSETHGTTRDYIEAAIKIQDIPIFIYDTAGLRVTEEVIESEGIRRSRNIMEQVNLVLYMVDGTVGIDAEDEEQLMILEESDQRVIKVWNKSDKTSSHEKPDQWISVSAINTAGFNELQEAIIGAVQSSVLIGNPDESAIIDSPRQRDLLYQASESLGFVIQALMDEVPLDLLSVDVQAVLNALGEITGEVHSEDILDRIFSGFCLGK